MESNLIEICLGPRCADYGGQALLTELKAMGVTAKPVDCQSLCTYSPVVRLNEKCILRATMEELGRQIQQS